MRTDLRDSTFNKTSFLNSFSSTSSKQPSRMTYNPREQTRDPSYDSFSKYRSEINNNDSEYGSNISGLITQSNGSRPLTSSLSHTDGFNNKLSFK
jgi:hypothetical protein